MPVTKSPRTSTGHPVLGRAWRRGGLAPRLQMGSCFRSQTSGSHVILLSETGPALPGGVLCNLSEETWPWFWHTVSARKGLLLLL